MSSIEITEFMIGWLYLLSGFSLLLQSQLWVQFSDIFRKSSVQFIPLMFLFFLLGLYVIQTHNIWVWRTAVIVTVLGWVMVLESALYFLCPRALLKCFPTKNKLPSLIKIKGFIFVILSAGVLYSLYCP